MTAITQLVNGPTTALGALGKRKRDEMPPAKFRPALYIKDDVRKTAPPVRREGYCKNGACVAAKKQHTHTGANCGCKLRAAPGSDRARAAARPNSSSGPLNPSKSPCCFCGGGDFNSECEKFLKLQNTSAFMALQETYEPHEIADLNLLISTTNRSVCKWCLKDNCDGSPDTCTSET